MSGHDAEHCFWEMPLSVVYAYEHDYYRRQGVDLVLRHPPKGAAPPAADLLRSLH